MKESTTHDIVARLQRGIALTPRPFAAMADEMANVREDEIVTLVKRMLADGSARRVGAVFDVRRLGFHSELCSVRASAPDVERIGRAVSAFSGVTHCYERGPVPGVAVPSQEASKWPNVWFTLAAPGTRFNDSLLAVRKALAPYPLRRLPAERRFKIDVVFAPADREKRESVPVPIPTGDDALRVDEPQFTEAEMALGRAIQGHVPVRPDFYAGVAAELGCRVSDLLETLTRWKQSGALRRMAMIVRHRRIGFRANAMCVWPVEVDEIVDAGRRVAARSAVTHCYQRPAQPDWPYTLFAMIHTGTWETTHRLFRDVSRQAGLHNGRMLGSLREFKKTSMRYFA